MRRELVDHHHRQRILAGAAAAIAERGYRQVTVAHIVKSAAVGRARFYNTFSSKEDCFLALYDATTAAALAAAEAACAEVDGDFPARLEASLRGLLSYLEAEPAAARACIVEGPEAGAALNERFEGVIHDFAALLRRGRGKGAKGELPETVEETVVGGLYWLLYCAILDAEPKRLGDLLPQLTEFAAIPFLGSEAARGTIAAG